MGHLEGVQPILVDWCLELVTIMDNSVACGVRDLTTQAEYVRIGASKTMDSKHLIQHDGYAWAVDLAPYPVDYSDHRRFYILAGVGLGLAAKMGVPIRWGGRWNVDDDQFKLPSFNDMGHFEIITGYTPRISA